MVRMSGHARRLTHPKRKQFANLLRRHRKYVIIGLVVLVGCGFLVASQAASPNTSFQAETNTSRTGVTTVQDSTASGNNYLQFGGGSLPQLSGAWNVVFSDDFSNATKSLTETWSTHPPFTTHFPSSVTITNGVMSLKTGQLTNYEWAHVSTDGPRATGEPNYPKMKAWREGYFEARIKYTDSEWSWPAFWLFSASKVEAWPGENCPANGGFYNAEWDMMENGVQNGWQHRPAGNWYMRVIHKNTTDNTADGYCGVKDEDKQFAKDFTGQKKLSDWHTWGGRWIGNQLCTYLDNELLNCETAFDTFNQPMVINIDIAYLGESCPSWCPRPKPTQLELQVDWVKVWKKT